MASPALTMRTMTIHLPTRTTHSAAAQRTAVVRVPRFLDDAEIASVHTLGRGGDDGALDGRAQLVRPAHPPDKKLPARHLLRGGAGYGGALL
eukprot:SAG25_NODE_9887_length_354_cov_0.596078_1_plen_91_part_01